MRQTTAGGMRIAIGTRSGLRWAVLWRVCRGRGQVVRSHRRPEEHTELNRPAGAERASLLLEELACFGESSVNGNHMDRSIG